MIELFTAARLLLKNIAVNIIVALLLGVTAFGFGLVYVAVGQVTEYRRLSGELAEADGAYYFEAKKPGEDGYAVIDELEGVENICYAFVMSGIADGLTVNFKVASADLYSAAPLPLASGGYGRSENAINVLATEESGFGAGDSLSVKLYDGTYEVKVSGVIRKDTPLYRFNGFSMPMTFESLFTTEENLSFVVSEDFLPDKIKERAAVSAVAVTFIDGLPRAEYDRQIALLKSKGQVFTLEEMRLNAENTEKSYLNLFLPAVALLAAVTLFSSAASVMISLEKNKKTLNIVKMLGADSKKIFIAVMVYAAILAVVAVIVVCALAALAISVFGIQTAYAVKGFAASSAITVSVYLAAHAVQILAFGEKNRKIV